MTSLGLCTSQEDDKDVIVANNDDKNDVSLDDEDSEIGFPARPAVPEQPETASTHVPTSSSTKRKRCTCPGHWKSKRQILTYEENEFVMASIVGLSKWPAKITTVFKNTYEIISDARCGTRCLPRN